MSTARRDQQRVLDSTNRIRVVRAVPGSGKTWLVAQDLKTNLQVWQDRSSGIAALSFTNVARDEIQEELGFVPSHPHFVGTIDSFLLRYIVQPFARLLNPSLPRIQLVPGDYAASLAKQQRWFPNSDLTVKIGPERHMVANVLTAGFRGEVDGKPVFGVSFGPDRPPEVVDGNAAGLILERKRKVWEKSGRLSHSDVSYFAYKILGSNLRSQVMRVLTRRFPFLVVDELQDTGWYMGKALQSVVEDRRCRGFLVGDPNQAIYEFSGASPRLFGGFSTLDGAATLEMNYTRRCPQSVRRVAQCLSGEEQLLEGDSSQGRCFLAAFSGDGYREVRDFSKRLGEQGHKHVLLTRGKREGIKLSRGDTGSLKGCGSRPLERLHQAVTALQEGRGSKAFSLAETVLARKVFKTEHMGEPELRAEGLDTSEWRKATVQMLLEAYRVVAEECIFTWGKRQLDYLDALLDQKGWPKPGIVRAPKKKLLGVPVWA